MRLGGWVRGYRAVYLVIIFFFLLEAWSLLFSILVGVDRK